MSSSSEMMHESEVSQNSPTAEPGHSPVGLKYIDWGTAGPYFLLHALCISVFWVGASAVAVITFLAMLYLRVFALTAFYHRYFSHKTFQTSRVVQFLGGFVGCTAAQRGPVWWAAHHRHHHRRSDQPGDVHSPRQYGFWWSHLWWFLTFDNAKTDERVVKDWLKFPELRWLEKFHILPAILLAAVMYGFGWVLEQNAPGLNTGPWQLLVWGFLLSTISLYHITYFVNSLTHVIGTQRFETGDDSRNNLWIALVTWGEGWHNNHHYYQNSTRQGFYWWEIDVTYYVLKLLSWCGIVWGLKTVPDNVLKQGRQADQARKQNAIEAKS